MPRENILFMIIAPLAVLVVVAIGVIGIGELLLAVGAWAHHAFDVDHLAGEEKHRAEELAKLYPVGVALVVGALALIAGAIASRLAGNAARQDAARH